ncbi:MAG: EAL domain-containing protein [Motiliproteus sp.]
MISFGSMISRLWMVMAVALLPTIMLVSYNTWSKYQDAREDIRSSALFYVGELAEYQRRHIIATHKYLQSLAGFDELQNPASPACGKLLANLLSLNTIHVNLGVPLANGDLLCNGFKLDSPVNVSDREYFRQTIDQGVFSVGSYQLDRAAGVPSINMAYPVRDNDSGEVVAAAVAVVSLSWWSQQLTGYGIDKDALGLVVDGRGRLLAVQGNTDLLPGDSLVNIGLKELQQRQQDTGIVELTGNDGIKRLFAYTPLHQNKGALVMVMLGLPTGLVYQAVEEHLLHYIEVVVLAILLLIILAGIMAREAVIKPVRSLLRSTEKLAGGMELDLPRFDGSELTTLADRFQHIVDLRVEADRKLKTSQGDLRLACIRLESLLSEAPVGIIEWDAELRVSRWSGRCAALFGLNEPSVLGLAVDSWPLNNHQFVEIKAQLEAVCSGASYTGHCTSRLVVDRNGSRALNWSFSAVRDDGGKLVAILSLVEDVTEQLKQQENLQYRASYDSLTGLPNRYYVTEQLEKLVESSRGHLVMVALLDLDNFKLINDTLGHEVGDQFLGTIAERIQLSLWDGEIVGRLGGDEFLLIASVEDEQQGMDRIQKLLVELSRPINLGKVVNSCDASVGLAFSPQDGSDAGALVKRADLAMYDAKRNRRGGVSRFTWSMELAGRIRFELESELRQASDQRLLQLHYQPIVCGKTGAIRTAEALLRWPHPEKGMIPPDQFIPIAEESGMIIPIGRWVIQEALAQLKRWRDVGLVLPKIAVNLSTWQLNDESLPEFVEYQLQENQLQPGQLTLELTESAVINADTTAMAVLNRLVKVGIEFSLDDFGTGYSSLSYLSRIPLNHLKIDRSFVSSLDHPRDQKLLASIVAMAHGLGLSVVAEGVETEAQLEFLRNLNCDLIQGYFYSKPLAEADFLEFFKHCDSRV